MEKTYTSNPHKKVFIRDILKIANTDIPSEKTPYHAKRKIDVMGTVVSVRVTARNHTRYHVDDSTGVISCIRFHRNNVKPENELPVNRIKKDVMLHMKGTAGLTSNILSGLEKLLGRLDENGQPVFDLGDTVNILGTVTLYNGQTEVIEDFCTKIDDPNGQTQRILEQIIHLHYVHR